MGLLERVNATRAESRAIGGVPWKPWDDPYWRFDAGGPVHPSRVRSGVDAALALAPVYAATRLIADGVASLPLQQYRQPPGGKKVKVASSPLFGKPSVVLNIYDWLFQCMTSLLLHGNAWGYITQRDGYGYPTMIEWLPADQVAVQDDQEQPWNPTRTRVYFLGREMDRSTLLHVRAYTVPGRTEGISPLRAFAEMVTGGQGMRQYGASWFRSGGFPPGIFQNAEQEIDRDQSNEIRRRLTDSIRLRQPLVYGRDWEYKPVSVPPEEAQFVEAIQMDATQWAAVYGVPADRIGGKRGDSLTYSTTEADQIALANDTLRPWLVRLETAFYDVVPQQQYVRFNSGAMIKTDIRTRYDMFRTARDIGLMNVDELRELEDMPGLPKPKDDTDYDGADYTPLQIQVAAARGTKALLGEGSGQEPAPETPAGPPVPPGLKPMPAPVPAANGSSNGSGRRG